MSNIKNCVAEKNMKLIDDTFRTLLLMLSLSIVCPAASMAETAGEIFQKEADAKLARQLSMANSLEAKLEDAIKNGNLEKVKAFVEQGAKIDALDVHMMTPLTRSLMLKHADIARYLIGKGANVNLRVGGAKSITTEGSAESVNDAKKYIGSPPLAYAISAGMYGTEKFKSDDDHLELAKLLIKKGADAKTTDDGMPLLSCINCPKGAEIAELLIENGADVNFGGQYKNYPIILQSGMHRSEIVKVLLINGADVNIRGMHDGRTALMATFESMSHDSHKLVLSYLLYKHAKIELKDNYGRNIVAYYQKNPNRDTNPDTKKAWIAYRGNQHPFNK